MLGVAIREILTADQLCTPILQCRESLTLQPFHVIHQSEKVRKLVPLMPLTNYPWQQERQKPKAICTDDWRHWWSRWSPVVLNPGSRTQLTERKQFREEHFSVWWNMSCKAFTGIIFGTAEEYLTTCLKPATSRIISETKQMTVEEQCALFGPCLNSIVYKWHKGLISHLCATTATPSHSSNRNSVNGNITFKLFSSHRHQLSSKLTLNVSHKPW